MKPAVFQVSEYDGSARLLCVLAPALQDAVKIESALRDRFGPRSQVTFLGRFDRIEMASGVAEFLDVAAEAGSSEKLEISPMPLSEIASQV